MSKLKDLLNKIGKETIQLIDKEIDRQNLIKTGKMKESVDYDVIINGEVMGCSTLIERVDAQGETNLIKVGNTQYYYIGTNDRDSYEIIPDLMVPDLSRSYKYIDGVFIDVTVN